MAVQLAVDVEETRPRAYGQLLIRRTHLDGVHEPEIDQDPTAGGYGSTIPPRPGAPDRHRDLLLAGQGKDLDEVLLGCWLKNEIRQTFEHQVTDERRKVDIEIIPEILQLLRIVDDLQVGVALQNRLERLVPRKFAALHHDRVPLYD